MFFFYLLLGQSNVSCLNAKVQLCIWDVSSLDSQRCFMRGKPVDLSRGDLEMCVRVFRSCCFSDSDWKWADNHSREFLVSNRLQPSTLCCPSTVLWAAASLLLVCLFIFDLSARFMLPVLNGQMFQAKLHQGCLCPSLRRLWLLCRGAHLWRKLRV